MRSSFSFYFFALLICIFVSSTGSAQTKETGQWQINYEQVDKDNSFKIEGLKLLNSFKTKEAAGSYLANIPKQLLLDGFPAASIDTAYLEGNIYFTKVFLGKRFSHFILKTDSVEKQALFNAGILLGNIKKATFNETSLMALQKSILNYYSNNGFPFAIVSLDNIIFKEDTIVADLKVAKNIQYKIDSIRISGSANLSQHFLQQELNIANGSLYSKKKLESIDDKLALLPYVTTIQPSDITMLGSGSVVNVYLDAKKSSQVDFLIGFLPNASLAGKTQVTGDVILDLKNLLGNGERFLLKWQSLQPRSPRLNLGFDQPYVLRSAFGINFLFDLYKRDSNYLQVNAQTGIQFNIANDQAGKLYLRFQKNSLLQGGVDTARVIQNKTLPADADVSAVSAGFIYEWNGTDYKLNPRKGNMVLLNTSVGTKKIQVNNEISQIKDPAFNYKSLYDSLKGKNYQFRLTGSGAHYFPLGKRGTIKTGLQGGWYQSPNTFRNELFLIGGSKLMRGFNDEEFFARAYAVSTLEYRYLLAQNSNIYVFGDFGIAENNYLKQQVTNKLAGIGIGLLNETKIGLINISVAAGKRNGQAFNSKDGLKLHFGYINYF